VLIILGLLGAGVLAASGLAIIPYRRSQLKKAFQKKVQNIREPLKVSMQQHFDHELQDSVKKLEENIEPYSRFIRAEKEKIEKLSGQLKDLQNTIEVSRLKIENLFKSL
jgi:archaellum component FlaC